MLGRGRPVVAAGTLTGSCKPTSAALIRSTRGNGHDSVDPRGRSLPMAMQQTATSNRMQMKEGDDWVC
ncbi:MAG: hypothetical protein ACJ77N_07810, partial [Chloroflexota bacterium]